MKMYLATPYCTPRITITDVDRATDSSVWIRGRRRARTSDTAGYFDSWKAAHDWFIERAFGTVSSQEKRLEHAQNDLIHAREILEFIQAMKEPICATPPNGGTNE